MAELYPIQLNYTVKYEGYVDIGQVLKIIRKEASMRGYDYMEDERSEIVREEGKTVTLKLRVTRLISQYLVVEFKLDVVARRLKDVTVELDDRTIHTQDGELELRASTWVITDYEGRYSRKPTLFFLRYMMEKFFWGRQIKKYAQIGRQDLEGIMRELRAYLNLFSEK